MGQSLRRPSSPPELPPTVGKMPDLIRISGVHGRPETAEAATEVDLMAWFMPERNPEDWIRAA